MIKTNEKSIKPQFFREFFARILGYNDIHGTDKVNLITEERDTMNQEPDGILGYDLEKNTLIRAVIEIKNCTENLDKHLEQAFKYATATDGQCEFVIISNFIETRLYFANDRKAYHKNFIVGIGK